MVSVRARWRALSKGLGRAGALEEQVELNRSAVVVASPFGYLLIYLYC
jgi:hypothetical protein